MSATPVCAMPLATAYLCEDCNFVGSEAEACVKCASRAVMSLANVLDREHKSMALPEPLRRLVDEKEANHV